MSHKVFVVITQLHTVSPFPTIWSDLSHQFGLDKAQRTRYSGHDGCPTMIHYFWRSQAEIQLEFSSRLGIPKFLNSKRQICSSWRAGAVRGLRTKRFTDWYESVEPFLPAKSW
jgi:hypothetical protein